MYSITLYYEPDISETITHEPEEIFLLGFTENPESFFKDYIKSINCDLLEKSENKIIVRRYLKDNCMKIQTIKCTLRAKLLQKTNKLYIPLRGNNKSHF